MRVSKFFCTESCLDKSKAHELWPMLRCVAVALRGGGVVVVVVVVVLVVAVVAVVCVVSTLKWIFCVIVVRGKPCQVESLTGAAHL